jgi:glycosyltransferase involved in cell wall biosynthesis
MAAEFARADVFCLPSLAEGSATSIFEALANKVPVVTTSSSGSVVSNGAEGFIVPERDSGALADVLERIITDRDLRATMSEAALKSAVRYNDATCGMAFIDTIRRFVLDR